jgi:hypothetical protein
MLFRQCSRGEQSVKAAVDLSRGRDVEYGAGIPTLKQAKAEYAKLKF